VLIAQPIPQRAYRLQMWKVRGGRRQFTFAKVMAWVALDRSVRDAERFKLEALLDRWRPVHDRNPPHPAGLLRVHRERPRYRAPASVMNARDTAISMRQ
jgi:hypothetical protein